MYFTKAVVEADSSLTEDWFRQRTPSHIYPQNMLGMDDRLSSIKGVREDIQVSKQQIYQYFIKFSGKA
jgi:hypothetical protein